MHEREKEGARKYERKKQGAGEREVKKRETKTKVQKEFESASARGFRTGGRMRKREDPKSTYPALHRNFL
jgi:hypothetical protein